MTDTPAQPPHSQNHHANQVRQFSIAADHSPWGWNPRSTQQFAPRGEALRQKLGSGAGFAEEWVEETQSAIGDTKNTAGRTGGFRINQVAHHGERDIGNGL